MTPLPAIPIATPVLVIMPAPMQEPMAIKNRSLPLSFFMDLFSFPKRVTKCMSGRSIMVSCETIYARIIHFYHKCVNHFEAQTINQL